MSKHTPGVWHWMYTHLGKAIDIGAPDGSNVALIHGPEENGPEEFEANARLIAAAPDLLESLVLMRTEMVRSETQASFDRAMAAADAAIAKATGQ